MRITSPKWVKRANQWCLTTVQQTYEKWSKHNVKQTQYWFSTEAEAKLKEKELGDKLNESKNNQTNT